MHFLARKWHFFQKITLFKIDQWWKLLNMHMPKKHFPKKIMSLQFSPDSTYKWALTPRSLNVKLGPRCNYHKGRAAIIRHYANRIASVWSTIPDRGLCSEYLWHIIWLAGAEAGQCLCAEILGQEMGCCVRGMWDDGGKGGSSRYKVLLCWHCHGFHCTTAIYRPIWCF